MNNSDTEFYLSFFDGRPHTSKASAAHVAQSVERILGKDEVNSSILFVGSII